MKIAVLLQGDPRFCVEFDHFLEKISGYDQVDWFCYMWGDNSPTSFIVNGSGHKIIPPAWQNPDPAWARNKLQENLPANHTVVGFELAEQKQLSWPPVLINYASESQQPNVWKMWYSQYRANQLRVAHEQALGFEYDVVVRTRPDVALTDQIHFPEIKHWLDRDPSLVLMPHNHLCGYGVAICDLFGMGSSKNMTIYTDIYNQALDHHARGCKFHPETMLAYHLRHNGLNYRSYNFGIEFRWFGLWHDRTTGQTFKSTESPNWVECEYHSNFGRWQ
jgi:hypothetical protein